MALPSTLASALESENPDALESAWLDHLANRPDDIDSFARAAELAEASQPSSARVLLELLDDALQEQELWEARLALIQAAGKRYLKAGRIHEEVQKSLRGMYANRAADLDAVLPAVGLDRGRDETPKLWDKVERLRNLLIYEVGTVVAMKDQGVGRVVEVNLALQTLKVDFERQAGVAVGFRAAGKILELIPDGHVLARKLEAPETLRALAPSDLLRSVLESYSRPLSGAEIRQVVDGLITKEQWGGWWAAARRHSQVIASGGPRSTYHWAETSGHAEDHLWFEFEAADVPGQLDLLRRASNQDPLLRERMVAALDERLLTLRETDPPAAFEIWAALERQPGGSSWQPAELLQALDDPSRFLDALGQRPLRERAYAILRDAHPDWSAIFESRFFRETDPRTLGVLAEGLLAAGKTELDRVFDRVLSQWQRSPDALVYLAERAQDDEEFRQWGGWRLLKRILSAVGDAAFDSQRHRLVALCDSGGTVPRLLSLLTESEAVEADAALERATSLLDYQSRPLREALHLRFPHLREPSAHPLYATRTSIAAKREELRQLLEEELPANRKAIEEARALGDLRENFEYKSARQRHEYLSARATSLSRDLERVQELDPDQVDAGEVRVGTRVRFGEAASERTLTILGPWESAPERQVISFESELGQRLLGKRVGDRIEVDGDILAVAAIEVFDPTDLEP